MLTTLARRGGLALLACTAGALLAPAVAPASPGPFAPDSVWDSPLSEHAPLAAGSSRLVTELRRQTMLPGGTWINTTSYSVPVYTVGPDQPKIRVIADHDWPPLQEAWEAVPLPAGARPAAGSDAHLVVYQPSSDTLWEFWAMYAAADGWHAHWGGRMEHVSSNPGYFAGTWGAAATGLALMGGLIRADELAAGHIDHALALGIPETSRNAVVWPAQRGDGAATAPDSIPAGTRFRIDPDLDLDSLDLAPAALVIARALQRYGMIVRDRSGAVTLYGEDPQPLTEDPWPGLFNEWPNRLLESLPWEHLQVVVADRSAFASTAPPEVPAPDPAQVPAPGPEPRAPTPSPLPVAVAPPVADPVDSPVAPAPPTAARSTSVRADAKAARARAVSAWARAVCAAAGRRRASGGACRRAVAAAQRAASP